MNQHLLLLGFVLSLNTLFATDTAPEWVQELSSRTLAAYPAEARSVRLLDEARVTVEPNGRTSTQFRNAVRILSQEGKRDAIGTIPYLKGAARIKDFHAWLIGSKGFVKAYGKDKVLDVASQDSFELYDEYRVRVINSGSPDIGSTFAWSAELEEQSLVPQVGWYFQRREPAVVSRYVLTLPPGWTAKGITYNHAPVEPQIEGSTYTWELKDLPFIKREPESPGLDALAPRLAVTYFPPRGTDAPGLQSLKTWSDVSEWVSTLTDPQSDSDEAMRAQVKTLVAGAQNDYQRIQAIGHYVQSIKYVAIQIDLARGGGYRPHSATQVFAKQYGDCKDKANLMRAMLKEAGVDSYLVTIFSGDRNYVRSDWPSPLQFNHAIIAAKVGKEATASSILASPALGRLLIFDPTDSSTPVGDLPDDEQGSYALVIAGNRGDIVKIPNAPPETNRTDVEITAVLTETGGLEAELKQQSRGQAAAYTRRLYAHEQQPEFRKEMEQWISESAKDVNISSLTATDSFASGQFQLQIGFKAPNYAQVMQQRLFVFRPSVVERWNGIRIGNDKRVNPMVLEAQCYHQQVHVKFPAIFKVDELPDPATLKTPFGKYSSTYELNGNELLFTQELDVDAATIPADQYEQVKSFFERVAGAEQAPVVLVKN
jgi:hypothetical protein